MDNWTKFGRVSIAQKNAATVVREFEESIRKIIFTRP